MFAVRFKLERKREAKSGEKKRREEDHFKIEEKVGEKVRERERNI